MTLAVSRSTVMPGQLATLAWTPVSRLNRVDLPVLGMPTRAMRRREEGVGAATVTGGFPGKWGDSVRNPGDRGETRRRSLRRRSIGTPKFLRNGVVVDWQPAPTLPSILGRPLQLRVLFKALVDNAVEAMSVKGWNRRELRIATTVEDDCLIVRVTDSGPGMPPEWRLRAFEPFFTTKSGGGRHLGTGLSRAQQVVADHGGFIDLSESASGGCTVTVEFRVDGDPL